MIRAITTYIVLALGTLLTFNRPPALPPVVRWNEHPGAKRVYGKALGFGRVLRMLVQSLAEPLHSRAGILNTFLSPLPDVVMMAPEQRLNLPQSLFLESIMGVISGTLTVANGTTDGTLLSDPIARLIQSLYIDWDGTKLVQPLWGPDIVALSRRLTVQSLTTKDVTSAGVQTTDFQLPFEIPFCRKYNADKFDTVLPPLKVANQFVLAVTVSQDVSNSNAATTAGSGAMISGGDRDVAISNFKITFTPRMARNGKKPLGIPIISKLETAQISAANANLELLYTLPLMFDGVLFRVYDGSPSEPTADLMTKFSFVSDLTQIVQPIDFATLRAMEESDFPGVQDANEPGTVFVQLDDGGKLGNAVDPNQLSNPKFVFDMAAPTGPCFVRAISMQLMKLDPFTRNLGQSGA